MENQYTRSQPMLDHARQSHRFTVGRRVKKKSVSPPSPLIRWQQKKPGETTKADRSPRLRRTLPKPSVFSRQRDTHSETPALITVNVSSFTKRLLLFISLSCLVLVLVEIFVVHPNDIANLGLPQLYAPLLIPVGVGLFCAARLKVTAVVAFLPAALVTMLLSLHLQQVVITGQVVIILCTLLGLGGLFGIMLRKLLLQ